MTIRRSAMLALVAFLAVTPSAFAAEWTIDTSHSVASFRVTHLMVSHVRGELGAIQGAISYDPADVTKSTVEATIDATGIDTRSADRDADLKSANFFDVEKFPTITFKSRKVEKAGEGRLKVTGDLTMKGVTKEVILDVEGPRPPVNAFGGTRSGASATATINRQDFGISYSKKLDGGGLVVGDEIAIQIEIEMTQKK